jgi:LysM repeat protein
MMKKLMGILIVIITLSMISLLGSLVTGVSARGESVSGCLEYRVKPGDTLWTIAKEYTDGKKDIRKYIYSIMKMNGMKNPDIMPGQAILIPLEV